MSAGTGAAGAPALRRPRRRRGPGLLLQSLQLASIAYLASVGGLLWWSHAPMLVGWQPKVVLTGSMLPVIRPGDVALVGPGDAHGEALPPGRIVLVTDPGRESGTYLHRVVRYEKNGFLVTKGDANPTEDHPAVDPDRVRGQVRLLVPVIGRPVVWLHDHRYLTLGGSLGLTWLAMAFALALRGGSDDEPDGAADAADARDAAAAGQADGGTPGADRRPARRRRGAGSERAVPTGTAAVAPAAAAVGVDGAVVPPAVPPVVAPAVPPVDPPVTAPLAAPLRTPAEGPVEAQAQPPAEAQVQPVVEPQARPPVEPVDPAPAGPPRLPIATAPATVLPGVPSPFVPVPARPVDEPEASVPEPPVDAAPDAPAPTEAPPALPTRRPGRHARPEPEQPAARSVVMPDVSGSEAVLPTLDPTLDLLRDLVLPDDIDDDPPFTPTGSVAEAVQSGEAVQPAEPAEPAGTPLSPEAERLVLDLDAFEAAFGSAFGADDDEDISGFDGRGFDR